MFVFRKTWFALFVLCFLVTCLEIHPFASLPTNYYTCAKKVRRNVTFKIRLAENNWQSKFLASFSCPKIQFRVSFHDFYRFFNISADLCEKLCSKLFGNFIFTKNTFFKLGFTPCKAERPLQGMELTTKKSTKRLKHTGNLFRKNLQLKDVC